MVFPLSTSVGYLMVGATVICTSSSDAKLAIAKKLGATHCINYKTFPAREEVLRITVGKGVDHVCEMGGSGTIEQSLKCVKQGGLVSAVGYFTRDLVWWKNL
jgi:NADPH:quinone reductase-like Zn-dependent oxidoreductase